jgi:hypothetical protein
MIEVIDKGVCPDEHRVPLLFVHGIDTQRGAGTNTFSTFLQIRVTGRWR